jgi:large exoprotein involved in heme utilization and adhesion
VHAGTLTLTGQTVISSNNSSGFGDAGRVIVGAATVRLTDDARISAMTTGGGSGGNILVRAGTLTLTGRAQMSGTTGFLSQGDNTQAGVVEVVAREEIVIAGQAQLSSNAFSQENASSRGEGGRIAVTAPIVRLTDDARISTTTVSRGNGGGIEVQAGTLMLTGGATMTAASTGPGNAGNVTLTLGDTFVSTHGSIVTRATQADGGNIEITTPTLVRLRDSAITAEVGGGATTVGGNITIDPQFVLLQNSQIVANAFAGKGGNIRLQAQRVFLADPASIVSASSALGINGQVAIQAPVTSISSTVAPLSQSFAQAAELLRSPCAARLHEGTVSTLVERGREGVPATPDGVLPSRLPLAALDTATPSHDGGLPSATRVSPLRGSQRDPSGPLPRQEWSVPAGSLRLLGECASR